MEIWLIRHGECENRAEHNYNEDMGIYDPKLTEKGKGQAEKLAEVLRGTQFDAIYSSDLTRAVETADALACTCPAERIEREEFREIDIGDLEEKSWEHYPDIYEKWKRHEEDIAFPGGECGSDVWTRVEKVLMEIVREDYKRVAIVTHGGVIMSTVCGILGLPQQKRFMLGHPIENCSVTRLLYEDGKIYLKEMNKMFTLDE